MAKVDRLDHISRGRRKRIGVIAVVSIALGAVFAYWWFSMSTQPAWFAKGTYATYEGSTITPEPANLTIRLEVTDCNSTRAKLQMTMKITTNATGTVEPPPTTIWLDLQQMKYEIATATPTATHEASIQYANKGTKNCTVYEYDNQTPKITLYVDKESGWIIRITLTSPQSSVDLNLVDTNIPALK